MFLGLAGVTIVDSVPFMRASKRRWLLDRRDGKWIVKKTPERMPFDSLLSHNLRVYSRGVREKVEVLKRIGARLPTFENTIDYQPPETASIDLERQYVLAPDWLHARSRLHLDQSKDQNLNLNLNQIMA